jgi:hypothetical protein
MTDRTIEWGVLWDETGEVEPRESQASAERLVAMYSWDGYVVSRTVTYSEWATA